MSRPLRLEYPGAWYHVMNRGAGQGDIYPQDDHRRLFLELLRELSEMFRVQTHAYCLMDNHYHLLLRTREANLGRAMRHLNGVYTLRHNRLNETDGPLFRGRYQAILIEADAYLLSVSRYIHVNPVAAGIVNTPRHYPWSSYRHYLNPHKRPDWLVTADTLGMIGQRNQRQRYRTFVEAGVDEATRRFYQRAKQHPILGSERFCKRILAKYTRAHPEIPDSRPREPITLNKITHAVAQAFDVPKATLFKSPRGRGQRNLPRLAAIHLARKQAGIGLHAIAEYFRLGHYGSVSGAIGRFERMLAESPDLRKRLDKLVKIIIDNVR